MARSKTKNPTLASKTLLWMTLPQSREIRKPENQSPRTHETREETVNLSPQPQLPLAMLDSLLRLMDPHGMGLSDQTANRLHVRVPRLLAQKALCHRSRSPVNQVGVVTVMAAMMISTADSIVQPRPDLLVRGLQVTVVVQGRRKEIHVTNTDHQELIEMSVRALEGLPLILVILVMRFVAVDVANRSVHSKCLAHNPQETNLAILRNVNPWVLSKCLVLRARETSHVPRRGANLWDHSKCRLHMANLTGVVAAWARLKSSRHTLKGLPRSGLTAHLQVISKTPGLHQALDQQAIQTWSL